MRLLEYIEYSVSPTTKFTVCAAISFALFIVYYWEPKRKNKKAENKEDSGLLKYMEVDPDQYNKNEKLTQAADRFTSGSPQHPMLEYLDDYVEQVKRHQIQNIDRI